MQYGVDRSRTEKRFVYPAGFMLILPVVFLILLVVIPMMSAGAGEAGSSGEKIYREKCVRCHGARGEGSKNYKKRLAGDRSVAQLAELIGKTMPMDKPGSLSTAQSNSVAAYIYDAFYSKIARARNEPPRIELAHLTVRQYRLAVSDLIGSFREPLKWGGKHGVTGDYFNGRSIDDKIAATRIDPQINFDFGPDVPLPQITEPRAFSIRWTGAIMAPETGEYEFAVRSGQATRLWINDLRRPLIDAIVKSGDDTERKATMFLIGGRVYPLRLDFLKANQGVDDTDKQKDKPPAKASVSLLWQRPTGSLEPIPSRNLLPEKTPEVFVCATPFPPDDRSYGWERGTSVSKEWEQATTSAAIETAGYIVERLNDFAGTKDDAPDRLEKLQTFCRQFAERAFRRPLTHEQAEIFVNQHLAATPDRELAVKRVILLVWNSPRFLYREVGGGQGGGSDVAARLSFGLWDSIPDRELTEAAKEGRLATREQVSKQAERMLSDLRARTKIHDFLLTWLKVDSTSELSKDPQKFQGFDAFAASDLRTSLELFLDEVVWSESSDYRKLMLCDTVLLNDRLAKLYGVETAASKDFTEVRLDNGRRAGILTHPYVLSRFAYRSESSPIHRGVFLVRGVLGQALRPPPDAFTPLSPELHPSLTTRERVTLQTKSTACMSCHGIINPLGFTLERFDAIGRYRDVERGKPVNDRGSYRTANGRRIQLGGARKLAEFVANSKDAQNAFVEKLFHHLVQQPVEAYGPNMMDELHRSFQKQEFNIRKLAVDMMATSSLIGPDTGLAVLPENRVNRVKTKSRTGGS